jgi:hypothetical protein
MFARYVVASQQMVRSERVAAVVRAAGYLGGDEVAGGGTLWGVVVLEGAGRGKRHEDTVGNVHHP